MTNIISVANQNTLFSALQYPRSNESTAALGLTGRRNEEMRALTIAAFRVAQNNSQLSTRPMNGSLLLFLLADSTSAVIHWTSKGRLDRDTEGYALTPTGLAECQNTLLGLAGSYSTTEEKVQEWVLRLVTGDHVACRVGNFPASAWP
jgi:hypothetical protein